MSWEDGSVPFSERFGDVYFSAEDGLAEARHVFLAGSGLPEAWAGRDNFTIGETGFGTGLNFCAVAKLWQKTRPPGALLHYVSIEGYPLVAAECGKALSCWGELDDIAAALIARYPAPVPGLHRIHFEDWGIVLTLAVGEAGDILPKLKASADAWFLDGFAPSRNPEMWREEVLTWIGRMTVPGGTLATFTSAGTVRRGLVSAGFDVSKVEGYGRKREMSVARKREEPRAEGRRAPTLCVPFLKRQRGDRIAIVGGGIAGCALARALTRRGVRPELYEESGQLGAGASGNARALVMPRMDAGDSPAARFHAAAYRFAISQYAETEAWDPCGVLVMLDDDAARERAFKARGHAWHPASLAPELDSKEASERAGIPLNQTGLFYEKAGLLETGCLLEEWGAGASVVSSRVCDLRRASSGVQLVDANGIVLGEADTVVLTAGIGNRHFPGRAWLPLAPVRGQLSVVPASDAGLPLRCALSWGGYLSPEREGMHLLGATHDPVNRLGKDWESAVVEEDHRRNHGNLPSCLQPLLPPPSETWLGRARLRAVTPDRVPLFGAVPDAAELGSAFGKHYRRRGAEFSGADILVLGGLGSRGFVTAPLAAEMLAARMFEEPWPLEQEVGLVGEPVRFAERAYRRGELQVFLSDALDAG
ncbi:bifunctional tRNA (5-methylaminomethyl-2-thiouridine)(34)-methyltransferase MnmD/FAD-dependent 5-carboxymethylaminomethyl-2-thiouridine(34) oxidoreductase MnmC [Nisaea acidiphila]|uniref:tRNA 5-methylaminomethyl-2-thiouridine biosynthesis bifunctional protein MnmC n=1 Tax=Nisaea acidiphila TaxID=1862145 RepID=A0A9J7AYD4_9PROT|nr:bifunctional tRNA (5-methylaminomethyl-2-thiouridine)(34)-methyltransferase MnmD/FAD-dependent 5-carboxymethylaminomethyl-2-thiouridine(34) oxidoreductase MnmC [Nisaea acidiphila]UUX52280.1 bifunctional tRNA (5-methylaminomethyl-2-thiouridine)(34)-methyltransferase MnmD/FAD-dependent 5-carboxymethylaminomethyl-2-thiouridine(34) oxidoreductase MnmC [Nisaea acidiphila]